MQYMNAAYVSQPVFSYFYAPPLLDGVFHAAGTTSLVNRHATVRSPEYCLQEGISPQCALQLGATADTYPAFKIHWVDARGIRYHHDSDQRIFHLRQWGRVPWRVERRSEARCWSAQVPRRDLLQRPVRERTLSWLWRAPFYGWIQVRRRLCTREVPRHRSLQSI